MQNGNDDDDSEGELPLDARERDAIRARRRREARAVLACVQREYALSTGALRKEIETARRDAAEARAELDTARRELARERADRAWASVLTREGADSAADVGASPALARYIADTQARCAYAELCCELRWHAHAAETTRMRADAEREAATYAVHLAACRREVADLRARADTAAAVSAMRAELARLEALVADARTTFAALQGDIRAALGVGGVARLRDAVRAGLRAEMAAEIRAEVMRAVDECRVRAAAEAERMRRDAHTAHEALVRHRAESARLIASLEGIVRNKCASEILRVRRDMARLIGARLGATASSATATTATATTARPHAPPSQ